MISDLIPGKVYRRRDLHEALGGQRQGGISTPSRFPVILLFTGDQGTLYGYHDGFQPDGTFFYTGEGQIGDMQFVRGNLAIRSHQAAGKALHLFKYVQRSHVQYVGQAYYIDHHTRIAPDRDGTPRTAIIFEMSVETPERGAPDPFPTQGGDRSHPFRNVSMDELRSAAYSASMKNLLPSQRKANVYHRSEAIKEYVLRRARGVCEGCGAPAPFTTPHGAPYLEPHHIRRRADNGPDHPQWVIAVCPNCHARVHRGEDGDKYNVELADRVSSIEQAMCSSAA